MTDTVPEQSVTPILTIALSPDFLSDKTAFAAGHSGLLRTNDGGETWQPVLVDPVTDAPLPATVVAISPTFSNDHVVFTAIPGGIGQSNDGGETWRFTTLPLPVPIVAAMAVSPRFKQDGFAFAGTLEDGVFRTENFGQTWLSWNFGLLDQSISAIKLSPRFPQDGTIFAGTSSGLYHSTNSGRSWRPLVADKFDYAIADLATVIDTNDDIIVLIGTESDGLWRFNAAQSTIAYIDDAILPESVQVMNQHTTDIVVVGDGVSAWSADGGTTWRSLPNVPAQTDELSAISSPLRTDQDVRFLLGTVNGEIHRLVVTDLQHP